MSLKAIWKEGLESDLQFSLRKGRLQPSWQLQEVQLCLSRLLRDYKGLTNTMRAVGLADCSPQLCVLQRGE